MTCTPLIGLAHLDLSVSDRHERAEWYGGVLGFEIQGDRFNEVAQLPWIHLAHPCGLSMGPRRARGSVMPDGGGVQLLVARNVDHLGLRIADNRVLERGCWYTFDTSHQVASVRLEAVSDPAYGDDELWPRRVDLDLLAEPANVFGDRRGVLPLDARTPHLLEQLLAGEHASRRR